jgi:hypothetical protein
MKFRRKPDLNIYEPEQFRFVTALSSPIEGVCRCCDGGSGPHVHTTHNDQTVALEDGDWIMPEPNGDGFYPIKQVIFESLYEPIE